MLTQSNQLELRRQSQGGRSVRITGNAARLSGAFEDRQQCRACTHRKVNAAAAPCAHDQQRSPRRRSQNAFERRTTGSECAADVKGGAH
jgi:hypothetical protein